MIKIRNRSAFLLLLPGVLAILLFLFFPVIQIALPTFAGHFGLSNYITFLQSHYNQGVLIRTLIIAFITMIITLTLGLPLSVWIARQRSTVRNLLSVVILFPILTNAVVRNFTWIIILGKNGVLNTLLLKLNFIDQPLTLLYSDMAIVIGSVYLFLPIMVTSLVSSVQELNVEVEEAAAILGSRPLVTFFKVMIPQLTTGILTGCILVFAGAMTAYTTPQLLGGNRHLVMSTLIYQQAMTLGDWSSASVVAIILIILTVLVLGMMRLVAKQLDRRSVND
ncbi:ABC transporter permease [Pediococcus ethanolidurans]|nr:ABC transporter permease [Pediococcus ethanolidurans]KRN83059.1 hypothetical protein IV87_GL001770 [Pediococcus ethanolidurans]GEN94213.1 spermidine/putrescine ABC transporter permease [Pediococcus ethanolidurans]